MSFVHLHNHTEFSLLDGAQKLSKMVAHAVELGQTALAQTDHGSGAGWYKFAAECRKQGIAPIIGIEAYLTVGGRDRMDTTNDFEVVESSDEDGDFDPTQSDSQREKSRTKKKFYEHLTLIAKNETGWRNLVQMVNESARSFRFKPRMDYELLREHSEGIICLTGCLAGPVLGYVARAALEPDRVRRKIKAAQSQDLFYALTRQYLSLTSRGLVNEGEFPAAKFSSFTYKHDGKVLVADFTEEWKNLAKDGIAPRKPSADAEFDTNVSVLGENARVRMLDEADSNLATLIDIFGVENTFVEIMEHGIAFESAALPKLARMAKEHGVRLVATNDAHYTEADDCDHHDKLLKIQRDGFSFNGSGYHLRSEEEMRELRDEDWWQEACDNTNIVAEMCEDVVPERDGGLPSFPLVREVHHGEIDVSGYDDTPEGHAALLRDIILNGLKRKGMDLDAVIEGEVVRDRLNHEFRIVRSKGFIDYFLMVWDLLLWSRANGIYIGMGRGSVAGSLMAYACEISWVEPMSNGLLFERFLEENRPDYPDMDLDFEKRRRAAVLAYLIHKYGKDFVARIGTFAVAASKRTVKDVLRVYGASVSLANQLTKLIPMDGAKPRALNRLVHEPDGQAFLEKWREIGEKAPEALETALAIEGLTVGESIHACGTLISNRPLVDLIPLRKDTKKSNKSDDVTDVTQWEAGDIEAYGLLKLDILGLRNLDIVSEAIKNIRERRGEDIDIYYGLPDPDDMDNPKVRKTYELLRAGKTAGVFQLESSGMTDLILRLSPDSFDDISALIALYRPGPMGANMHHLYADRKNGRESVDYSIFTEDKVEQEWIAKALGDTYGTFVYQEQLMNLGTIFAGFDPIWRNKLRKATAKKKKEMLDEVGEGWFAHYGEEFRDDEGNVISPKFSRKSAETMWSMMQASAEYLFNKAHSAAYGMLTYITAYLKANYTAEYCAAILAITELGKPEKRRAAFSALRDEGIEILPPSVNASKANTFPYDDQTVIIGLSEIKGLKTAGESIAAERHYSALSKPFTSLNDLVSRVLVDGKPVLSTSDIGVLIESGACDEIIGGYRRGAMIVSRVARNADIPVPPMEWGVVERSLRQRSLLGVSLGENPLVVVQDQLREWVVPGERRHGSGTSARPMSSIPREADMYFTTIGILGHYAERSISSGKMANLSLEGTNTILDGVMFQRAISSLSFAPEVGQIVAVSGYTRLNDFVPASHDDDDDQADLDVEEANEGTVQEAEARLELSVNHMWEIKLDDPSLGDFAPAELSWSEAIESFREEYPDDEPEPDDDPDDDPDGGGEDDDSDETETDDDESPAEVEDYDTPMIFDDDLAPAARVIVEEPPVDFDTISGFDPFSAPDDWDDDDDDDVAEPEPEPSRRAAEPESHAEDDDDDWLDNVEIAPPPGTEVTARPSAGERAPRAEDPAPVIPITQKQVEDGRKVPILYKTPTTNPQSTYETIDPYVTETFRRRRTSLIARDITEQGGDVKVTLYSERDYESGTDALRYVLVSLAPFSDFDLGNLPSLFDTDGGTKEPTTLQSLYPEGEKPRRRNAR